MVRVYYIILHYIKPVVVMLFYFSTSGTVFLSEEWFWLPGLEVENCPVQFLSREEEIQTHFSNWPQDSKHLIQVMNEMTHSADVSLMKDKMMATIQHKQTESCSQPFSKVPGHSHGKN